MLSKKREIMNEINSIITEEIKETENNGQNENLENSEKGYISLVPGKNVCLSESLTKNLKEFQKGINNIQLYIIVQGLDKDRNSSLCYELWEEIYINRNEIEKDKPIAIFIDSPGGQAAEAYRIARFFKRRCGEVKAIVPKYAKSAATLLSLGAKEIIMGEEAELGPLDVQITDFDKEDTASALDETQSIDGLFEFATGQIINISKLWSNIFHKRIQTVFPFAIDFVTNMMRPLMEKIDTIHYSSYSRSLRIGQEYASRLLSEYYDEIFAKTIAEKLVTDYPGHGFIINLHEAKKIGLNVVEMNQDLQIIADNILDEMGMKSFIGKFFTK